ncbi:MAG: MaoC family dehydratase [Syntrophorhabdaceae bacterium]|nr:MaoC family dehydratase [Syntrophorhabdaceae bacterium]
MNSDFPVPKERRYFEDYLPGSVYEFGAYTVEEEEIIAFAKKYDPQIFHVDPVAAKETVFGGLIASGWHTAAITMRLLVDHYVSSVAGMGSPGADSIVWYKPVRPGDTLSIRVKIEEARVSNSKPDRGIVTAYVETLNQRKEVVMTRTAVSILKRRSYKEG